jgi:hypothetical protein
MHVAKPPLMPLCAITLKHIQRFKEFTGLGKNPVAKRDKNTSRNSLSGEVNVHLKILYKYFQ